MPGIRWPLCEVRQEIIFYLKFIGIYLRHNKISDILDLIYWYVREEWQDIRFIPYDSILFRPPKDGYFALQDPFMTKISVLCFLSTPSSFRPLLLPPPPPAPKDNCFALQGPLYDQIGVLGPKDNCLPSKAVLTTITGILCFLLPSSQDITA